MLIGILPKHPLKKTLLYFFYATETANFPCQLYCSCYEVSSNSSLLKISDLIFKILKYFYYFIKIVK